MKKIKMISLAAVMAFGMAGALHAGDPAILCDSSASTGSCSGKHYCCYSGSQSDGDKYCKQQGCKRSGTGSCPTAANVKSCGTRVK